LEQVKGFVGIVLAALALAAPAAAQEASTLEQAAASLRTDPVYIHPGTDMLTEAEAESLRRLIGREGNGPIMLAILPAAARAEADDSSTQVALRLGRLVRIAGVYAVVVGNEFRAVSTDLGSGRAAHLATQAFNAHRDEGVAAVLADFVQRVGEARGSGRSAPITNDEGSSFWLIGLAIGAVALLVFVFVRRRRRAAELAEVKAAARDDLVALADDVTGLDEDVERNPQAKEAYTRAIEEYQRADDAFDRARAPRDVAAVTSALADARYEMETAKAHLAGREPPEPRPPCFFDPRHGSSVRDVWWDSPYRGPVLVPACERDVRHLAAGEEPESRQVTVGGRQQPFWQAPAYFGPWAGGYYGSGLLPGLLAGSLLGSTFAGPADAQAAPAEGSWGDFGGGDFGGGDFGGGDFGGGGDF
jgi:uncharacterized membrane protein YgcG